MFAYKKKWNWANLDSSRMLESADVIDLPVMRSCGFEIGPNEPDRNWIGSTEIVLEVFMR